MIADYVDPRAHKFFRYRYSYVGKGNSGADENGCDHFFNTGDKITPTKTVRINNLEVCAYCARRAKPLQKYLHIEDYETTGYCCVCSDAMDEMDFQAQLKELEAAYNRAKADVYKRMPKTNMLKLAALKIKSLQQKIDKDGSFLSLDEIVD